MKTAELELPLSFESVNFSEAEKHRFWKSVNRDGPTPDQEKPFYRNLGQCWEWIGWKTRESYGRMYALGKNQCAHRVSWMLHHKTSIPEGKMICHRCDNPSCVNPAHLFIGDHTANMIDRSKKGRENHARGDRHFSRSRPHLMARGDRHPARIDGSYLKRGEENPAAKLTKEQVIEIRNLCASGRSQSSVGKQFGIEQTTVSGIVRKRIWKHV